MKKFKHVDINLDKPKVTKEDKIKLKEEKKRLKQEKKDLKKENKKVLKTTKDFLPFLDIDDDDVFITKYGYMEIYQIETKDIYSLNDYEMELHKFSLITFLRNCVSDFKIVSMNFPVNTRTQQEYINNKLEKANNPIAIKFLEEKKSQFEFLESNRTNQEYFLLVFSKDKKEVTRNIMQHQNRAMAFNQIDVEKKLKILFKLNNLNTKLM